MRFTVTLRDAQIPLVLWLSAASVIHIGGGTAAAEVAELVVERRDLVAFSQSVRELLRPDEVEVEILTEPEPAKEEERELEEELLAVEEQELEAEALAKIEPPEPEPDEPERSIEEEEEEEPEPDEKQAKPEALESPPQQLVLPKPDGRIAIKQHQAEGQQDNPNAARIADHAHHTDEETMARIRAYDQDSPDPSPGEARPGPQKDPGNAAEDEAGFAVASEEEGETRPGDQEGSDEPQPPAPPREPQPALPSPARPSAADPRPGRPGRAPVPGQEPVPEGTGAEQPEAVTSDSGEYSLDPSGGNGTPRQQRRTGRAPSPYVPAVPGPMGFNQPGPHNLSLPGLMDAIGQEQLQQERERARNARKRKHRGAFAGADFQRYRAAIENYDPSVKPGNQTSLNAARVPFASYINRMHNRIHPVFADGFLGSLDKLSRTDPLNQKLVTHLELVLDKDQGRVVRMGVTKPSGVTAFDIGALKSAEAAGPYGPPPEMIISPDGRVYVHWEFHRDPYYACTSRFARPYLIKGKGKGPAPLRPERAPAPAPADERYRTPKKSKPPGKKSK
ncbi:MAG: hypothetical protein JRI23_18445 [Deltaproteobacteria bacterium]|nr:hypothetical protein [Deltaproteobacteria bacterium]MBW2533841.1 hypothetical protein [Deltaproteobacteria bacterium]